jgi:hypothetical protein
MNKNHLKIIFSLLIVAILIISGIFAYFLLSEEKIAEKKQKEKEIDDRISPLTNQAIFLQIHRIRKKGIIDVMEKSNSKLLNNILNPKDIKIDSKKEDNKLKILKNIDGLRPGKSWDEKPSFSYIAILDGYEFKGRQTYKCWDTGYFNNQIFRNVEEEKPETVIEFQIIEKIPVKQLFKTKMKEKVMDHFIVVYDYRKGTWDGDDSFKDIDGYGHYDGENYEIWFSLYQTSSDMDSIPWWVEKNILDTNPEVDDSKLDPDNDGIPTEWEWKWGYDPFEWDNHTFLDPDSDGLQNIEEYSLEKWLANPYHPEIYIEADYMAQTPKKLFNRDGYDGWKHTFYEESQQMLMERFCEHGITVHIDDGRMGQGGEILPFGRGNRAYNQEAGVVAGFYANNFAEERKGVFRYLVIAYGGGWCHPQDSNHFYDCMCVPDNKNFYKNQLGFALTERTKRIGQAISVMHELGHSLGILLEHSGGVDNCTAKAGNPKDYPWYDYVSVMNYDYYMLRYFDYSDGSNGKNDADDWDFIDLTFFQRPSEEMEGVGA